MHLGGGDQEYDEEDDLAREVMQVQDSDNYYDDEIGSDGEANVGI